MLSFLTPGRSNSSIRRLKLSFTPPDIRLSPAGCFFELSMFFYQSKNYHYVNDRTVTQGTGAGSPNHP